jgi:hypothetical protein
MIRQRIKIVGDDALRAHKLGLGEIRRSCNGELTLYPPSYRGGSYRKDELLG